jgi:hypothetical protein
LYDSVAPTITCGLTAAGVTAAGATAAGNAAVTPTAGIVTIVIIVTTEQ